jgi:hypothetical protein
MQCRVQYWPFQSCCPWHDVSRVQEAFRSCKRWTILRKGLTVYVRKKVIFHALVSPSRLVATRIYVAKFVIRRYPVEHVYHWNFWLYCWQHVLMQNIITGTFRGTVGNMFWCRILISLELLVVLLATCPDVEYWYHWNFWWYCWQHVLM